MNAIETKLFFATLHLLKYEYMLFRIVARERSCLFEYNACTMHKERKDMYNACIFIFILFFWKNLIDKYNVLNLKYLYIFFNVSVMKTEMSLELQLRNQLIRSCIVAYLKNLHFFESRIVFRWKFVIALKDYIIAISNETYKTIVNRVTADTWQLRPQQVIYCLQVLPQ